MTCFNCGTDKDVAMDELYRFPYCPKCKADKRRNLTDPGNNVFAIVIVTLIGMIGMAGIIYVAMMSY